MSDDRIPALVAAILGILAVCWAGGVPPHKVPAFLWWACKRIVRDVRRYFRARRRRRLVRALMWRAIHPGRVQVFADSLCPVDEVYLLRDRHVLLCSRVIEHDVRRDVREWLAEREWS